MRSVGIRELRQHASALLRRVALGECIEITDRGRPVARLTPLPAGGALERMRASGDVEGPAIDDVGWPDPVDLEAGVEPPSRVLQHLRENER